MLIRLHRALGEQREGGGARDLPSNRMLRVCAAQTKVVLDSTILERVEADDGEASARGQGSGTSTQQIVES